MSRHNKNHSHELFVTAQTPSGKSANEVISMVHHFMGQNYPILPRHMGFMADNCPGQNKNRWLMWYCSWLTLVRPECETVTLHFMVPGHTKMLNDGKFGLLRR